MTYTALDGHIIESSPSGAVVYECECTGIGDGVYESLETFYSPTPIGIEQIKIVREAKEGKMTITITESTSQELIDYQSSLSQEPPLDINQIIG
jgi:hypothetical protein